MSDYNYREHGGTSCDCYFDRTMGDPNKAMGSHGVLNPPNPDWLPHAVERVVDSRGISLGFRCTRCEESITHKEWADSKWMQVLRSFTPVCPVW